MNQELAEPMKEKILTPPVEIPFSEISPQALLAIVDSFILREGTDYGAHEISLEKKQNQLLSQIRKGDLRIFFDPESQSVNLVSVKSKEYRDIQN